MNMCIIIISAFVCISNAMKQKERKINSTLLTESAKKIDSKIKNIFQCNVFNCDYTCKFYKEKKK